MGDVETPVPTQPPMIFAPAPEAPGVIESPVTRRLSRPDSKVSFDPIVVGQTPTVAGFEPILSARILEGHPKTLTRKHSSRSSLLSSGDVSTSEKERVKTRAALAMSLFPTFFSIFCFGVFMMPAWLVCTYVSGDMNVKFWMHPWPRYGYFFPVLYAWTHAYHHWKGKPSKPLMFLCIFGSALFFLVSSVWIEHTSDEVASALGSMSCDTFEPKVTLENDWQAAQQFFTLCIEATVNETGIHFDQAIDLYRIRQCAGYEHMLAHYPSWEYLADLEDVEECAGWCFRTRPLWTHKEAMDSCSTTVADLLHNKIRRAGSQIQMYFALIIGLLVYLAWTCPETIKHDWQLYW